MQETLQDRLQQNKNVELLKRYLREAYPDPRPDHALCGLVDDIISHTISETIKAGVTAIEELEQENNYSTAYADYTQEKAIEEEAKVQGFNQALQTAVTKLQELDQDSSNTN